MVLLKFFVFFFFFFFVCVFVGLFLFFWFGLFLRQCFFFLFFFVHSVLMQKYSQIFREFLASGLTLLNFKETEITVHFLCANEDAFFTKKKLRTLERTKNFCSRRFGTVFRMRQLCV